MQRRTLVRPFTLVLLAATLAACNTFEGLGRDIQSVGEAVSNSAD